MKKPLIGITLSHCDSGSFSAMPHYALKDNYFTAVAQAGGVPVGLGYLGNADDYLDQINGLLTPGGEFATPPEWYVGTGETAYRPSRRLDSDLQLIRGALRRDMPVLGICAGMQLMAGLSGCKLAHNLRDHFNGVAGEHFGDDLHRRVHDVKIAPGTILASCTGTSVMPVNSKHREAVVTAGPGVRIAASSPDGVIEAIELPGMTFALGVEWHPEAPIRANDPSAHIFRAFVSQARHYTP